MVFNQGPYLRGYFCSIPSLGKLVALSGIRFLEFGRSCKIVFAPGVRVKHRLTITPEAQRRWSTNHHKALSHRPTGTSAYCPITTVPAGSQLSNNAYQSKSSHKGSNSSSTGSIFTWTGFPAVVMSGCDHAKLHVLWWGIGVWDYVPPQM
jgi:hypothetical protein